MQPKQFKKGDRVEIIAQGLNGKFFHEGTATVLREARDSTGVALVQFNDARGGLYPRWIDPEAQIAPKSYAAEMNRRVEAAKAVKS